MISGFNREYLYAKYVVILGYQSYSRYTPGDPYVWIALKKKIKILTLKKTRIIFNKDLFGVFQ